MLMLRKIFNERLYLLIASIYIIALSSLSILKHYNLYTFAYDLGIFMQSLYTTLNGGFFYETPDLYWNKTGNFLSVHFSILAFILLPIYYLLPYAETLLILQSLLLGSSGIILYKITLNVTGDKSLSNILLISYLSSAALHGANLYDFHMESFIPFLIFLSTLYFIRGRVTLAALTAILLMLAIYTLAPLIILSLTYLVMLLEKGKRYKYMLQQTLFSTIVIGYFLSTTYIFLPVLGETPFKPGTVSWFPYLGDSWSQIIYNVFSSPQLILQSILYQWQLKILYWIILSCPVAFLYLLNPKTLIPLSYWIIISWLTSYEPFFTIGWQYVLIPLPFIYLGSVFSLQKVRLKKTDTLKNVKKIILALSILNIAVSPINPLSHNMFPAAGYDNELKVPPRSSALNQLFDNLSSDQGLKILTTNNLFPHFANRFHTYVWLPSTTIPDYIVVDLGNIGRIHDRIGNTSFISQLRKLVSTNQYGVYAFKSGVIFLKRGYRDEPIILEPYTMRYNYRHLFCHSLNYSLALDSESLVTILCIGNDRGAPIWFGPYTILIPGHYSLKIRMKLYGERCLEKTFIEVSADKGNISITGLVPISSSITRINKEWILVDLVFTIDKTYLDIEFRGWSMKNCRIELDYAEISGPY